MTRSIPTVETLKTVSGCIALGASFLLLSPGVEIARAESPAAGAPTSVDASAQPPSGVVAAEVGGEIEQVPRVVDPRKEAVDGIVVLNTRGYNYGPDRPTARPVQSPAPAAPAPPTPPAP